MKALYYGDNLQVLRDSIATESVDLIYLDPQFNSNATYNVLFRSPKGEESQAQIEAFEDTWHWTDEAERAFDEVMHSGNAEAADMLRAMRSFLGENDVMAYLTMMAVRLLELHRVLKPTGSLYLHCDPTASHYLKILLDAVFEVRSFTNEIIWIRTTPKGLAFSRFASNHDVIFFYRKTTDPVWNSQYMPYSDEYLQRYNLIDETTGRRFQATSLINPNPNRPNLTYEFGGHTRVWRWTKERMLRAEQEGRIYFPSLIEKRLNDAWPSIQYEVHGTPKDLSGAKALADYDKYQFQWWAVSLVNAVPIGGKKKGADKGIDGAIYFKPDGKKSERAVVSVKGGHNVGVAMVRDLKGVMEREKAPMGFFITLAEPTAPMKTEAASAGVLDTPFGKFARLQILTIEDLFAGKKPETPPQDPAAFKKAAREEDPTRQGKLI